MILLYRVVKQSNHNFFPFLLIPITPSICSLRAIQCGRFSRTRKLNTTWIGYAHCIRNTRYFYLFIADLLSVTSITFSQNFKPISWTARLNLLIVLLSLLSSKLITISVYCVVCMRANESPFIPTKENNTQYKTKFRISQLPPCGF